MTSTKSEDMAMWEFLFGRGEFPLPDMKPLDLPEGFYVCMECGQVTSYWEPGQVCASCEAKGERQMEEDRGN